MVTSTSVAGSNALIAVGAFIRAYVAITVATIVALGVLSVLAPAGATQEAWVHGVIVAVFAVVLPLRWRAARRGSVRGLRAVGLICAVLFLVNVVEALIPVGFPTWMRLEMLVIAVMMLCCVLGVVRTRLAAAER